jgi:site-specific DNA recombinase
MFGASQRFRHRFDIFSILFRKRRNEAGAKAKEIRAGFKLEIAAVEKKTSLLLDRVMAAESLALINRYEQEIEKLEREKLVLAEKTARCGTALPDYDESFRTARVHLKPLETMEKWHL